MANQNMEAKQANKKPASLSVMLFDLIFMNPFSVMKRMTEEMDRVFQTSNSGNGGSALWAPAVEVSQTDSQYVVRAELPGVETRRRADRSHRGWPGSVRRAHLRA